MSEVSMLDHFQCDICGAISGTYTVIVPMPGLRVAYHVCSDDCEEEARQRGRNAWDEWNKRQEGQVDDETNG